MTNPSKPFHLGDLLSVTTERLVSPDHVGGLYKILNHMTGDSLMTHQLPQASRIAKPYLLDGHPFLLDIIPPESFRDEAHVWSWLDEQVDKYGAEHEVTPMPSLAWGQHAPFADLRAMTDKPILTVKS